MRIRTIKPEFWASESVGRLSRNARLLYIGLWSLADDSGRFRGALPYISGQLFPYDSDAAEQVGSWVDELLALGMVRRYEVDGTTYMDIPKWLAHQKIEKPSKSRHPPFTEHSPNTPRTLPEMSAPGSRILDLGKGSGAVERARAPAAAAQSIDQAMAEVEADGAAIIAEQTRPGPDLPQRAHWPDWLACHGRVHVGPGERDQWEALLRYYGPDLMGQGYDRLVRDLAPGRRVYLSAMSAFMSENVICDEEETANAASED